MNQELPKLEKKLGLKFKNKNILLQALVHRSYINENPHFFLDHNERLEFLGDAALELAVTEYLYKNYPNPEGELTNWRASLVNSNMLAKLGNKLKLDDYLLLSRGESKDKKSKARQYILANAFEALLGALYLDRGFEAVKNFIEKKLICELPYILKNKLYIDPKSRFQEIAQEKLGITPTYKVENESGPDHAKKFRMAVYVGEEKVAIGTGSSKQEGQVKAAEKALKKKGWE
ncbi:ribonuclease III [Candidatus Parcubacteria bacterium]|nr:MAG: ribonuclease III [Candidatus Parcubacteria bacterium]